MMKVSRRGFITQASMVGAVAAVGTFAAVPTAQAAIRPERSNAHPEPATASHSADTTTGDVVVHIRNASTGEVSVMTGTSEYVVTDHRLVASVLAKLPSAARH
jgi:hypothetical protein